MIDTIGIKEATASLERVLRLLKNINWGEITGTGTASHILEYGRTITQLSALIKCLRLSTDALEQENQQSCHDSSSLPAQLVGRMISAPEG